MKGPKNSFATGRGFDINDKLFLLTWPKTAADKRDSVFINIMKRKDVVHLAVSSEKHRDGTPHVHAYLELKDKTRLTGTEMDSFCGKHGHYKRITKTPMRALGYVLKDADYQLFNISEDMVNAAVIAQKEAEEEYNKTMGYVKVDRALKVGTRLIVNKTPGEINNTNITSFFNKQ